MRLGRSRKRSPPWCWRGGWSPWTHCCASGRWPGRSGKKGALPDGGQGEPPDAAGDPGTVAGQPGEHAGADATGGRVGVRPRADRAAGVALQCSAGGEDEVPGAPTNLPLGARAGDKEDGEAGGRGRVWDQQFVGEGSGSQDVVALAPGRMEDREPVALCAGRDLWRGPFAGTVREYPPGDGGAPKRGDRADAGRGAAQYRGGDPLLCRPPLGGPRPDRPPCDFQIALVLPGLQV